MTSIKWIVASVCLIIVHAAPDDSGPQIFQSTRIALSKFPRGYVMKEVTLFLTPSQIKALEASKESSQEEKKDGYSEQELQKLEAEIKKQLERQHIYINGPSDIQKPGSSLQKPPPQVVEPVNENPQVYIPEQPQQWTPIPKTQEEQSYFLPGQEINLQNPTKTLPQSYSFVKIYTDEKVHETPKLQLFHPIPHQEYPDLSNLFEVQRDPLHSKEYKLIPYEYLPDSSPGAPKIEEVKEISKWLAGLDKKGTPTPSTFGSSSTEDSKNLEETKGTLFSYNKDEANTKYAPNFDEEKHKAEYQNFVLRLEKENALSRAEAILKSASESRRKGISKLRPLFGYRFENPQLSQEKSPIIRHVWKY